LQGNALRVLRRLGVLDECLADGWASEGVVLRAPDKEATVLARLAEHRSGGPDLPASMGMYRPTLAAILMRRAERAGVRTRFGTGPRTFDQTGDSVTVSFSDGTPAKTYDLVVAADGIRSGIRRMLNVPLETRPIGMGAWRVFAPRPAEVVDSEAIYGGPCYIAGCTPTSESSLYAFLIEDAQDRTGLSQQQMVAVFRELAETYHGPWDEIRASITDSSKINYTWFEEHLLDPPWHRGRVVFIGDAAHTCPPTLAQGAAMALEDAWVLAELLTGATALDDHLLRLFADRRVARVRPVVEASVQIARWQLSGEQGDVPTLMHRIATFTSEEP
jgi:2-polyprenyl-6-methoxyphenol hydroxylase-like FAD-dependent oxidoreductase